MKNTFVPTKWTLVFLLLAAMLTLMGGAAVAPALPLISEVFSDVPEFVISMIITLPSLAVACTGYLIGTACDKFGRRPVLLVSLAVFAIAGSAGFYLDSLWAILISRVIPVMAVVGSYGNLFLVAGMFGILVACVYAVAWQRERRSVAAGQ